MKKTINILLLVFANTILSNAFELNKMTAKDVLKEQGKMEFIAPAEPKTKSTLLPGWELTAQQELRNWLKYDGIRAKVSVVYNHGKEPSLLVKFDNRQDYERIKDIFYDAPVSYPTYMGVRVSVRVPKTGNSDSMELINGTEL